MSSKYTFRAFSFPSPESRGTPFRVDFNKAIRLAIYLRECEHSANLPSDTSLKSVISNWSMSKLAALTNTALALSMLFVLHP